MITQILIKHSENVFELIDGSFVCTHSEAYLEEPCCDGSPEEGRMTCGCMGVSSIVCPTSGCTGVEDHEVNELMEKLL